MNEQNETLLSKEENMSISDITSDSSNLSAGAEAVDGAAITMSYGMNSTSITTATTEPEEGEAVTPTPPGDSSSTTTTEPPEGEAVTPTPPGDSSSTTTTTEPVEGEATTPTAPPDGSTTTTTTGPVEGEATTPTAPPDGSTTTTTTCPVDGEATTPTAPPGDSSSTTTTTDSEEEGLTYTVSYNLNGGRGSVPESQTVPLGQEVKLRILNHPRDCYKLDHIFQGWNTNASGTGTLYRQGERVLFSSDTVLYAKFSDITS